MSDHQHAADDRADDPVDQAILQALERTGRDLSAELPPATRDRHLAAIMDAVGREHEQVEAVEEVAHPTWFARLKRMLGLTTAKVAIGAAVATGAMAGLASGSHLDSMARAVDPDTSQQSSVPATVDPGDSGDETTDGSGPTPDRRPVIVPTPATEVAGNSGAAPDDDAPAATSTREPTPTQTILPADAPVPDLAEVLGDDPSDLGDDPSDLGDDREVLGDDRSELGRRLNLDLDHLDVDVEGLDRRGHDDVTVDLDIADLDIGGLDIGGLVPRDLDVPDLDRVAPDVDRIVPDLDGTVSDVDETVSDLGDVVRDLGDVVPEVDLLDPERDGADDRADGAGVGDPVPDLPDVDLPGVDLPLVGGDDPGGAAASTDSGGGLLGDPSDGGVAGGLLGGGAGLLGG